MYVGHAHHLANILLSIDSFKDTMIPFVFVSEYVLWLCSDRLQVLISCFADMNSDSHFITNNVSWWLYCVTITNQNESKRFDEAGEEYKQ